MLGKRNLPFLFSTTNIDMKQLVTLEDFKQYNNYYEEDTDELCQSFVDAASNIVADYIGYDPNRTEYEEYVEGIGSSKLFTSVTPISDFSYVKDTSTDEILDDVTFNEKYIYSRTNKAIFEANKTYEVHYEAGYKVIPADIRMAVLRIGSLMLAESNGNIGVTGKSNLDQSKTFISYSNYSKYLQPLIGYRSKRIC